MLLELEEVLASNGVAPPSPTPLLSNGNGRPSFSRPSSPATSITTSSSCQQEQQQEQQQQPGSSKSGYKMGYFGATSYVIGNIIGSGIFISPSTIIRYTDSAGLSLIIWVLCALIAFLGSLCYIELGTSIREAGCDFAYICYVKWYSVAFSFMWVSVLMTYPATIAIIAETFGQYVLEGLRQTYAVDPRWAPTVQKCFGIALLWLITWMNFFALGKFAARFQIAATLAKLLACALIILTGFYYMFALDWNEGLREPMANSRWHAGDLMMGLYGGLYAYSGWDILNYGTDEIERPRRNAPLALLSGIFIVFLIYFCINIAYFVVLDVETMKSSNAVAAASPLHKQ